MKREFRFPATTPFEHAEALLLSDFTKCVIEGEKNIQNIIVKCAVTKL